MDETLRTMSDTREILLRTLLRQKAGLTIERMAESLNISRNAVRQHLISLERDGYIAKGETRPSGGRPEQIYVLTTAGMEHFPRQYSWLSELLLQGLQQEVGDTALGDRLDQMGRRIGQTMKKQLPGEPGSDRQLNALAEKMTGIGYDAGTRTENGQIFIEAHNCIFHKLALKHREICNFDIALLSESSGCRIEHRSCMTRGGDSCRFHFTPASESPDGEIGEA